MNIKQVEWLHGLYRDFAQTETDVSAKHRLTMTADAMESLIAVNDALSECVYEVDELVQCEILPYDCDLAKNLTRIRGVII